jgi:hypothetical protein
MTSYKMEENEREEITKKLKEVSEGLNKIKENAENF